MTMNRGYYTVSFSDKAATAAMADFDFFELSPAAEKPIEIVGIFIGQTTAEGDANEDYVRWTIRRITASFASGGELATTPVKLDTGDGASSCVAEAFNAVGTVATGTSEIAHTDTFNIRTGLQYLPPPEMRIKIAGNEDCVVRCESTMDATTNFSGSLYFVEV
jgi:hypothetical protein